MYSGLTLQNRLRKEIRILILFVYFIFNELPEMCVWFLACYTAGTNASPPDLQGYVGQMVLCVSLHLGLCVGGV